MFNIEECPGEMIEGILFKLGYDNPKCRGILKGLTVSNRAIILQLKQQRENSRQ